MVMRLDERTKLRGMYVMKRPVPEDFGMTTGEYQEAATEYRRLQRELERCPNLGEYGEVFTWIATLITLVVWFITSGRICKLLEANGLSGAAAALLGVFVLGPVVGLVAGLLGGYVVFPFVASPYNRRSQRLANPLYTRVRSYEEAVERYQLKQEQYWLGLRGQAFEKNLADLYRKLGYTVKLTKGSRDGGVDLYLHKDGKKTVVQCKGHEKPIGVAIARDLYGTFVHSRADGAILACPAGFTEGVRTFAAGKPMQLVSAKELVAMAETVDPDPKEG
jgi:hypothetical protein